MNSPEQSKLYTKEEAQEEAFKMVEKIKMGDAKDYTEAAKQLENIKEHEKWLAGIHEEREKNHEEADKKLFGFEWEDEGGHFELEKNDIEWLCEQLKRAGQSKEYKTSISLDGREREQIREFLGGVYGSQDVYRIVALLDRVFSEEAKNYNLAYGAGGGRGFYLELQNDKNRKPGEKRL